MKGKLTSLVAGLCALTLPMAPQAGDDFLLLDDYFAQRPEQRQLTERFRTQVQSAAVPIRHGQYQPVRIAVVYPAQQQSDYWRRSLEVFKTRLDQLNVDYQLNSHFSALTDTERLQQHVREALLSDPDYLVFTLDSHSHRRMIERILARGRPKLILQNITTPVTTWKGAQPLLYTGFDHLQGTRILAERLFKDPATAPRKVSVLFRDRGYVSTMRGRTFISLLQRRGAELVSSYYTRGDQASARTAALDALDHDPDLDLIYACSTDVALGAAQAIEERDLRGKVLVNGWGGGREELAAIEEQVLDLTVVRLNEESSIAMAEAIKNDLSGTPVPQVYNGQMESMSRWDSPGERQALAERAFPHSGSQP